MYFFVPYEVLTHNLQCFLVMVFPCHGYLVLTTVFVLARALEAPSTTIVKKY